MCAGQAAHDADGNILHPGDIGAQLTQSFDNLETVLGAAGTDLSQVVRLNYYTTDVDALLGVWHRLAERLSRANCRPASTLLDVTRVAFPEMLVEIEATAFVPWRRGYFGAAARGASSPYSSCQFHQTYGGVWA